MARCGRDANARKLDCGGKRAGTITNLPQSARSDGVGLGGRWTHPESSVHASSRNKKGDIRFVMADLRSPDGQVCLSLREVALVFGELCPTGLGFEIETDRWPARGNRERQRRLAYLARPQQGNRRDLGEGGSERGQESAGNHACNFGTECRDWGAHSL